MVDEAMGVVGDDAVELALANPLRYDAKRKFIYFDSTFPEVSSVELSYAGVGQKPTNWNECVRLGKQHPEINGTIGCVRWVGNVRQFSVGFQGCWGVVVVVDGRASFFSIDNTITSSDCRNGVRSAIESLYKAKCTITNFEKVVDSKTKRTTVREVEVVKDEPCRLSFSWNKEAQGNEVNNALRQTVKLFLRPELTVKGGSKITVTQNGVTKIYESSGEPAVHSNHQEILLVLGSDVA